MSNKYNVGDTVKYNQDGNTGVISAIDDCTMKGVILYSIVHEETRTIMSGGLLARYNDAMLD